MFDFHSLGRFGVSYTAGDLLTCLTSSKAHILRVILGLLLAAATGENGGASEKQNIMKSDSAAQK